MTMDFGQPEHDTPNVRPYTLTGGRTRSARADLALETLVEAAAAPSSGATKEQRDILAITRHEYRSVAEVSAHTQLPLGVVRVLIGDLEAAGLLVVHGLPNPSESMVTPVSVLESVLDGICAL